MKAILYITGSVILILFALFAIDRFSLLRGSEVPQQTLSPDLTIEEIARGLDTPWDIAFTSPDRMLITERAGRVRLIENGLLRTEPLHTFAEVAETSEGGLMSLTLDPDYAQNKHVYLSLQYDTQNPKIKIIRMTDAGNSLGNEKILLDNIPSANVHAGSRVRFGPDGKLYITTGDATQRNEAQNKDSLLGKILRINMDGSIPADNPAPGSPLWSYGHRNPQGIAWHPETGELYEVEHGPSVFDGPAGGDEVNRIVPGGNYGWPLVSHNRTQEGTVPPLIVFTPAEAPASALFYTGDALPQFKNSFFFGALRGRGIMRIVFDPQQPDRAAHYGKLEDIHLGRIRALAQGPDGFLYFGTSNRDGRGDPAPEDDRIFRIVPK
jgi:glucose/arabinose dehydrogenase